MRELLIVGLLLGTLLLFGLSLVLALDSVFYCGTAAVIIGFAFGIPCAAVYHVALFRSLRRRSALQPGWYWRPVELHVHLTRRDKTRTLPWFYSGALGFLVIIIGLALIVSAVLRLYLR